MSTCSASPLRWAALASLMGAALAGQSPDPARPEFSIRPRYGTTFGAIRTDTRMDQSLGIGIEGTFPLGPRHLLVAELVYSYYPGKVYDNTRWGGPVYVAAPGSADLGNPSYTLGGPAYSADVRKNSLAGFSLRLGGGGRLDPVWTWQAGLTLDALKCTQEVSGILQPVGSEGPLDTYEGLAATPHKVSLGIGAFAGLQCRLTPDYSLALNGVCVGYSALDYKPFTYTGQAPSVATASRHGFGLELVFGLRI